LSGRQQVVSAGGVVVAAGPGGVRVLVLHHVGYDEWRLPKGKLRPGETAAQAAEREVHEETGLALNAGRYLGAITYTYADPRDGAPTHKIVYFFAINAHPEAQPIAEAQTFDAAQWLPPRQACERLTWPNEAEMVWRAVQAR